MDEIAEEVAAIIGGGFNLSTRFRAHVSPVPALPAVGVSRR
jgi:hypothetical protein